MKTPTLSRRARLAVLLAAFGGLVFDGWELGLMPIASLSMTESLLGESYTAIAGGDWFARLTASLMLGAATGGILLGNLGDRIGRVRAMGLSILFYSGFAGLSAFVTSLEQTLVLRFLCGLGIGGMWPNGVALVSECWPNVSRPWISGILGTGINVGVLLLSQVARIKPITPDSWRWLFGWSAIPAVLGVLALWFLPESPKWLAARKRDSEGTPEKESAPQSGADLPKGRPASPLRELFRPPLVRLTLIGILLGSIPLVGAWSASKWMIPWADKIGGTAQPGYKAATQGWWALGSTLGSFFGAQLASRFGRRVTYFLISLGATVLSLIMFNLTAPLRPSFLPVVFVQGFVATLFFGWLPLYLPELFPTRVRATGSGLAFNTGRFATAVGIFAAGSLVSVFHGDFAKVGSVCALAYAFGMLVIWWAPDTSGKSLEE